MQAKELLDDCQREIFCLIYIPWPFPQVWGVACNTKDLKVRKNIYSEVILCIGKRQNPVKYPIHKTPPVSWKLYLPHNMRMGKFVVWHDATSSS